jgi:hypothetical protein
MADLTDRQEASLQAHRAFKSLLANRYELHRSAWIYHEQHGNHTITLFLVWQP